MTISRLLLLNSLLLGLSGTLLGCAQPRPFDDLWIDARPYHAQLAASRPPANVLDRGEPMREPHQAINPTGEISLSEAVALTLQQNPELAAAGWGVTAAEADAMQLGRPKNPSVSFSADNIGGPDGFPVLERQTLRLSQVIELAGKRSKRQALGEATQRLRAWDYEQQRIELAATTATRYVTVLVSQERLELSRQQLKLAQSAFDIAEDRATNGTAPGFERDQAAARLSLSRIAFDQADQALTADRADLAASWGANRANFEHVNGDLNERIALPSLDELREHLPQSPHVARWEDEIILRQAALELQRANAVTDPRVGAGVRYFPDADDTAGVAEVSWPLPILDDNEHGILAARFRIAQAKSQRDQAQAEANRALTRAYARTKAAAATINALQDDAIPASRAAHRAALDAYEAGDSDYLTVLDAERTLLELESKYLDGVLDYHASLILLEHITANDLSQ